MAGKWAEQTTFAELIDEGVLEIGDGYRAKNEELGGSGPIFLRAGHVTDTHIDFSVSFRQACMTAAVLGRYRQCPTERPRRTADEAEIPKRPSE